MAEIESISNTDKEGRAVALNVVWYEAFTGNDPYLAKYRTCKVQKRGRKIPWRDTVETLAVLGKISGLSSTRTLRSMDAKTLRTSVNCIPSSSMAGLCRSFRESAGLRTAETSNASNAVDEALVHVHERTHC